MDSQTIFQPGLMTKWNKYILPDAADLKRVSFPNHRKMMIAHMLENSARSIRGILTEDTDSSIVPTDNKMILPVVRKLLAQLVAYDLAAVQPLTQPTGVLYLQSLTANRARGNIAAGTNFMDTFSRYYSSEFIDEEPIGTGNGATTGFSGTLIHTPIRPYSAALDYSVVITDGTETFTDDGAGVLTGDAGGSGTIDYATGAWAVTFNAAPGNGDAIVASYSQNFEGSSDAGEMSLSWERVTLNAKTRRSIFSVTEESLEDAQAQLGLQLEAEMVSLITQFVQREIDREIVMAQINNSGDSVNITYNPTSTAVELEHIRNLLTRLSNASARIFELTKVGAANYIVCPPAFTALLEQLSTHANYRNIFVRESGGAFDAPEAVNAQPLRSSGGLVKRIGTLQNKWAVYEDPLLSVNAATKQVLLGLRGSNYFESGTIFAPYVPLTFTSTVEDVATASRKKGIRTRYALKVHRPEFYMTFNVGGLETY